jgi:hypothetical protein
MKYTLTLFAIASFITATAVQAQEVARAQPPEWAGKGALV